MEQPVADAVDALCLKSVDIKLIHECLVHLRINNKPAVR